MYKAEVLAKLPVAQHIFFGSLLPFPVPLGEQEGEDIAPHDEHGHIHVKGEMWGDCCGYALLFLFVFPTVYTI